MPEQPSTAALAAALGCALQLPYKETPFNSMVLAVLPGRGGFRRCSWGVLMGRSMLPGCTSTEQ